MHCPHVHDGRYLLNSSHSAFNFVKWTLIEIWFWTRLSNSCRNWNIRGPLLCWNRSWRSNHISVAESEKMILVELSLEAEFNIQKITTLLFLSQELRRSRSSSSSLGMLPSMKPTLFFTNSAMVWHESMTYNYPQLIVETQAPDRDY